MKKLFLFVSLILFTLPFTAQEKLAEFTTTQMEFFPPDPEIVRIPQKYHFQFFSDSLVMSLFDKRDVKEMKQQGKPSTGTLVHKFVKLPFHGADYYRYEGEEYTVNVVLPFEGKPSVSIDVKDKTSGKTSRVTYSTPHGG